MTEKLSSLGPPYNFIVISSKIEISAGQSFYANKGSTTVSLVALLSTLETLFSSTINFNKYLSVLLPLCSQLKHIKVFEIEKK